MTMAVSVGMLVSTPLEQPNDVCGSNNIPEDNHVEFMTVIGEDAWRQTLVSSRERQSSG